jgi:D-serine deaminase-like pyridoxal phosphate-dependent protein
MITWKNYRVEDPDALETPAMLVFRDVMDENIRQVCEMVGGGENLIAHVKTHKSGAVARRELELGIGGFKCATLKELEMVLEAGAAERLCDLVAAFPEAWIATIASSPVHLESLGAIASRRGEMVRVMLDLDAGMHRTGIGFGPAAFELYRQIDSHEFFEASGFHVYDGHQRFSDVGERERAAQRNIEILGEFQREVEAAGLSVPLVVGGGSYSFPYYARTEGMFGSPGTFIYWDAGYAAAMPDVPFGWAALVLIQVVDRHPDVGTVTTDLGSKAVSSDLPEDERALLLGCEGAELVGQSEEHGVFRMPGALPEVGEYLLAVPGHICPTTIRYPGSHVVDSAGTVIDYFLHTARDRA